MLFFAHELWSGPEPVFVLVVENIFADCTPIEASRSGWLSTTIKPPQGHAAHHSLHCQAPRRPEYLLNMRKVPKFINNTSAKRVKTPSYGPENYSASTRRAPTRSQWFTGNMPSSPSLFSFINIHLFQQIMLKNTVKASCNGLECLKM